MIEGTLVMTEIEEEIGVGQEKEVLTPRRYQSPNLNLESRNRSTSRVTRNKDRVRCYKCREYDILLMNAQIQSQMVMNQTELHYS